jgi:hypothetical protein
MLCVAALLILLVLSIFSAKYRPLVREAFDCVSRRVTFRACDTGFDIKVRSAITAGLMTKSPKLAKFFNARFELISWLFVATLFWSLFASGRGVYLFWTTGSCNGLNQSGFCVLDPTGSSNEISGLGVECHTGEIPLDLLSLTSVNLDLFYSIPGKTDKELVFIGCYACEYTRKAYPVVKELIEKYEPKVTFIHYPSRPEAEYLMAYDLAVLNHQPEAYFDWLDQLYTRPLALLTDEAAMKRLVIELGVSEAELLAVLADPETARQVMVMKTEVDKSGIFGTPTVFIDGEAVVGPKPYRVYRMMLQGSWF